MLLKKCFLPEILQIAKVSSSVDVMTINNQVVAVRRTANIQKRRSIKAVLSMHIPVKIILPVILMMTFDACLHNRIRKAGAFDF